jgi:crotonobetainyl-CoA:carnitine CoA-transferase CaiB-like acyl-CoA transferase
MMGQDCSPADIVSNLWNLAGGDPAALAYLKLAGSDPVLPSSFRIGTAAQACIAASGLAAAELHHRAGAPRQQVGVDMRHAAMEFRSEHYLSIDGNPPESYFGPFSGIYRAGDGRLVRLHMTFQHHRDNVIKLLGCPPTREAIQEALEKWEAIAFETAAYENGCVVSAMRSPQEWAEHPQAAAVATMPVIQFERIGEAPARPLPMGPRPLSGIRVLDLTRILAGPVSGRTLAAHGAEVMLISAPDLPSIAWLVKDTGRGKLSAYADITTPGGQAALGRLVKDADIFLQAFRPGALSSRGFGPTDVAALRPGIIYVSLSAYGETGPWASRRGFDSLIQTASGFNHAEGKAAGVRGPKELPCQAVDHASGYLLAFGAIMARIRQANEGGSWLVRVCLAGTARWIWNLGRVEDGFTCGIPSLDDVQDLLETSQSPSFGTYRFVRHSAQLSQTPVAWTRPSVPLGTHPPEWGDAGSMPA